MRKPVMLAAVLAAALLAGCSGESQQATDPKEKAQITSALQRYVDDDDCSAATRRYLEESYPDAADPLEGCRDDPYNGLLAGQYEITSVSVDGDSARVQLLEDGGGRRTYSLVKEKDRWLVSQVATKPGRVNAQVGQALYSRAAFELNGRPAEANMAITVLSIEPSEPPDPYSPPKPGSRYWKMKAKVKSFSRLRSDFNTNDLSLLMAGGQRYAGEGYPFEPTLGNCCTTIAPGDTLTGYASFQVPKSQKKALAVQYSPTYDENGPYKWSIK